MKIYLKDKNSVLSVLKEHFEITPIVSEAEAVLLWKDGDYSHIIGKIQPFIDALKIEKHLPLVMYQHGGYIGTNRPYARVFPKYLAKYLIWGEKQIQFLLEDGVPMEKIVITGTPIFDHLKPRVKHKGTNVLFAPISCRVEWLSNFAIAEELRKSNFNIITKITNINDAKRYDNTVYSHVDKEGHWKAIADVLSKADIVVSSEDSTLEMLARYLDIPVVTYLPKQYQNEDGRLDEQLTKRNNEYIMPGAKRVRRLSNLNNAIKQQLEHPDELRAGRQKTLKEWGGVGVVANPLQKIIDEIKQYEK